MDKTQLTFTDVLRNMNLEIYPRGGKWGIYRKNGKVLRRKSDGKIYDNYCGAIEAMEDLERDLVDDGLLVPSKQEAK
ncbi:hypothetical protein [Bacillus sp. FSL K6-6540]|uniref:hypothetical protein n=1 Tax=Bacillus sp. FSL K6-6540 TaxID=2921512 RepID=UPI0030F738BC